MSGSGILMDMSATPTATPVEIDTELARLSGILSKERNIIARYEDADPESYTRLSMRDRYQEALTTFNAALDDHEGLTDLYTGWARYYHVNNVGGHIHTSMYCSSCFPDTEFMWRTDLSALTPEEVVEREAHNACSVCMPIAPVEQRAARERYNREQREARAAERQAKKDAKAEKAHARAVKLADKVEAEIAKLGGVKVFHEDDSLHGHDGRKSLYEATFDMPTTVGNVLYEIKDRAERGHSHHSMNEHVKAELTKRGLA